MKREADEQRLAEFRGLREEAWRIVKADLARLQSGLEDRGVAERIKDRIGEEAHDVWDATREIAAEHKGVVAATIAALVAWFLRGPIGSALASLLGDEEGDEAEQDARENAVADKGENP